MSASQKKEVTSCTGSCPSAAVLWGSGCLWRCRFRGELRRRRRVGSDVWLPSRQPAAAQGLLGFLSEGHLCDLRHLVGDHLRSVSTTTRQEQTCRVWFFLSLPASSFWRCACNAAVWFETRFILLHFFIWRMIRDEFGCILSASAWTQDTIYKGASICNANLLLALHSFQLRLALLAAYKQIAWLFVCKSVLFCLFHFLFLSGALLSPMRWGRPGAPRPRDLWRVAIHRMMLPCLQSIHFFCGFFLGQSVIEVCLTEEKTAGTRVLRSGGAWQRTCGWQRDPKDWAPLPPARGWPRLPSVAAAELQDVCSFGFRGAFLEAATSADTVVLGVLAGTCQKEKNQLGGKQWLGASASGKARRCGGVSSGSKGSTVSMGLLLLTRWGRHVFFLLFCCLCLGDVVATVYSSSSSRKPCFSFFFSLSPGTPCALRSSQSLASHGFLSLPKLFRMVSCPSTLQSRSPHGEAT